MIVNVHHCINFGFSNPNGYKSQSIIKYNRERIMQKIIKAEIYFDGEYYCARTLDIDVFTQGKTLDETIKNLKEAVTLHMEDEIDYGLQGSSILAMMEVAV